ncbi:MAG: sigma-54 dependent transcriptional regulator [Longimicrobiales bacterium]|nr:sigma-54 dependent transcriptional regulator [Longimicrobiales bacterium]
MAKSDPDALNILVVDDEASSREAVSLLLKSLGHAVDAVATSSEAVEANDHELYDLALVDLRLGGDSGLDLVTDLLDNSPWLKVAVITAHASIDTAVEAIRRGAVEYIQKPVTSPEIEQLIRRVATLRQAERDKERFQEALERAVPPPRLTTENKKTAEVYAMARRAATSNATILIRGESGTGKGVLAKAIHRWSDRSGRPFSSVNTPALSKELLESELFGHVKGAFTGAVRSRPGRIAKTEGGTLFLDEIGALPVALQPKLLRFLQDRKYERVGSDKTLDADVRMILATNRNLEQAVEEGEFREDLYFRIRVIEIEVPPLRERPEDILPLAESFVAFFGARNGRPGAALTDAAKRTLMSREWPGNVRELQNAVERAVILSRGSRVGAEALPAVDDGLASTPGSTPLISLEEAERRHIEGVLEATSSAKEAAKVLGISTTTLWRRRQKHDL